MFVLLLLLLLSHPCLLPGGRRAVVLQRLTMYFFRNVSLDFIADFSIPSQESAISPSIGSFPSIPSCSNFIVLAEADSITIPFAPGPLVSPLGGWVDVCMRFFSIARVDNIQPPLTTMSTQLTCDLFTEYSLQSHNRAGIFWRSSLPSKPIAHQSTFHQ